MVSLKLSPFIMFLVVPAKNGVELACVEVEEEDRRKEVVS